MIPLLDVFSNALGAAAFLFVVFPALSIDATRTSTSPDPSTTTTVGQEAIWLVIADPAQGCAFVDTDKIHVDRLKRPDRLLLTDPTKVLVLLHSAEQSPTFTVGPMQQSATTPGTTCGDASFTLQSSLGPRTLQVAMKGDKIEVNVNRYIKKPTTP